MDFHRLTYGSSRLTECLDVDVARLRSVVRGADLTATVPTCPDWTMADLVRHLGAVYLHKVECMRLGAQPQPWPPDGLADQDPVALVGRSYAALKAEFATRSPDSPAFTWYRPDQTVGFWIRRMAQETVIHRVDAELGAGEPISAIPDDVALDGIDELLHVFVAYGSRTWPEEYADILAAAKGGAIRVATPTASWSVRLAPDGVLVSSPDQDRTDAVVRGEPSALLLWLWNRAGDEVVTAEGDADALTALRRVLVTSTQ